MAPTNISKLPPPTTRSPFRIHRTPLYTTLPTINHKLPPPATRSHYNMHQTTLYTTVSTNIPQLPTTTMPYNTNQSSKKAKNPTILTI